MLATRGDLGELETIVLEDIIFQYGSFLWKTKTQYIDTVNEFWKGKIG